MSGRTYKYHIIPYGISGNGNLYICMENWFGLFFDRKSDRIQDEMI